MAQPPIRESAAGAMRCPPEGNATICLGVDACETEERRGAMPMLDERAAAGCAMTVSPGIAFGMQPDAAEVLQRSGARCAPGGKSSLSLGLESCEAKEKLTDIPVHEECSAASFSTARQLGIALGAQPEGVEVPQSGGVHCTPGGQPSIWVGIEPAEKQSRAVSANAFASGTNQNCGNVITDRPSTGGIRNAPGGKSSICLGMDPVKEPPRAVSTNAVASGADQNLGNSITGQTCGTVMTDRPTAGGVRCAPGGNSTICLGMEPTEQLPRAVSANAFASGSNQNCGNFISDRPTTGGVRRPPGGNSTICLGMEPAEERRHQAVSANTFACSADQNTGNVVTDQPTTGDIRRPHGGNSTVCLGNVPAKEQMLAVSGDAFASGTDLNCGNVTTGGFRCAPGGNSTICLGMGHMEEKRHHAVSANAFACGTDQNSGNVVTDRPTTGGIRRPPGGNSTLCLSHVAPEEQMLAVSANAFASNTDQKCGNVINDRPITMGVRCTPGGDSTICLGMEPAEENKHHAVSAKAFACGADQNSGNVVTDGPTTGGIRRPPGGNSTLCLGKVTTEEHMLAVSANAFASGTDQNWGNVITDRPTTGGVRCAPGGNATICLGDDGPIWEEEQPRTAPAVAAGGGRMSDGMITERPMLGGIHQAPGGNTSVCLGEDGPTWPASAEEMVKSVDTATTASVRFALGGNSSICPGVEDDQSDDGENDGTRANLAVTNQTEDGTKIIKAASSSRLGLSSGGGVSAVVLG
eukprot:NODE_1205_length_2561_cov_13.511093.p1 GENE.NODE_1205_length_2561_cov_13.511093~~NODE_1205_length_2561_cov_13.511093.p1  ORF type:complete len:760 (-),score=78.37 NODE_1205_length_2561_cov_13.511093:282-2534(-)